MHLPPSHHHPNPLKSLAPHLLLHLPYSLPILRIIQHTAFNPDARIFSTLKPDDKNVDPQQAWAAVYVERSRFPETECWLFSTFESWVNWRGGGGSHGSTDSDGKGEMGRREAEARVHMLRVLNDVAVHASSALQTGVKSQRIFFLFFFLTAFTFLESLLGQRHHSCQHFSQSILKRIASSMPSSPYPSTNPPSYPLATHPY